MPSDMPEEVRPTPGSDGPHETYLTSEFISKVRHLAEGGFQNAYFRGLVSKALGSQRMLDDDLFDLVVKNNWLQAVYDDLLNTPLGLAKVETALKIALPRIGTSPPSAEEVCRLVWGQAVEDPRFDLILKQAIEDAKVPPQAVRGSGLFNVAGMLDRIRAALTSGASRHSNAVLAGSALAGILAGSAATKLAPNLINNPPAAATNCGNCAVVSAINALTAQVRVSNEIEDRIAQLDRRLNDQRELIEELETQAAGNANGHSNPGQTIAFSQVQDIRTDLNALQDKAVLLNTDINSLNIRVNDLAQWRNSLPFSLNSKDLESLVSNTSEIASYLGSSRRTNPTIGAKAAPNETAPVTSVDLDLRDLNTILRTISANAVNAIPPPFTQELQFQFVGDIQTIDRVSDPQGNQCDINLTLTSVSARTVKVAVASTLRFSPAKINATVCGLSLPQTVSIDTNRVALSHAQYNGHLEIIDLALWRVIRDRTLPFKMTGAVVSLYRDTR